jgi:hypothetical protein
MGKGDERAPESGVIEKYTAVASRTDAHGSARLTIRTESGQRITVTADWGQLRTIADYVARNT